MPRPSDTADWKIVVGTFKDDAFSWHDVSTHKNFEDAYRAYKKYVQEQLDYTDEELEKVWSSGRVDVELLRGTTVLNWVGIYTHEVSDRVRYGSEE